MSLHGMFIKFYGEPLYPVLYPKMDISSIGFSIWSAEDILKASVVEVTESKCLHNGVPVEGGLRDPRFGCIHDGTCAFCGKTRHGCPGHWGHISFPLPLVHIAMVAPLVQALRQHCPCGVRSKKKVCACGRVKDRYTWVKTGLAVHKNGKVCPPSEFPPEVDRFLVRVLPVPPIHIRPPLTVGNTTRGENDLTYRLVNIVRKTHSLCKALADALPSHVVYERYEQVQHAVADIRNAVGTAKHLHRRRPEGEVEAEQRRRLRQIGRASCRERV